MKILFKKILVFGLAIVAIGAIYFSFLKPEEISSDKQATISSSVQQPGEIYSLSLTDMQGQAVEMEKEKLVFINVWATWCGPCNMEMPGIQKLYNRYKDNKKVAFYIISDEDINTTIPFIERKGYDLPFFKSNNSYPAALDGNAIPRTYIVYNGEILIQEIGASQWDRPEIIELINKRLEEI